MKRMHRYTVQTLGPSQVRTAYPLIQAVLPAVDLNVWSRFARRTANPKHAKRSGIVVAICDTRLHPSGLAIYRKEDDLRFGHVLTVDHFVAFDLVDRQPVTGALIAAMETLGRDLQCDTIRWNLTPNAARATTTFFETGHGIAGTVLYKCVGRNAFLVEVISKD